MIYKIETHIPMPGSCSPDMVDAMFRLAEVAIGSSVFFAGVPAKDVAKKLAETTARTGANFAIQETLYGTKLMGTRVWRSA